MQVLTNAGSVMIDLATAALIAKMASDAVGAFDKIFRGYVDVLKRKEHTASLVPPPDFSYVDSPQQKAIVARSRSTGRTYQTVTYDELCRKLEFGDRQYVENLTRAMQSYERQWNAAYEQRAMASGMEIGKLDSQLEYLAREMSHPLTRVLDFVERMGLHLDDHYHMARAVTRGVIEGC
jgi:DNA polymerase I-like protein with 3'-5' exonuclease and polymerase domains